MGCFNDNSCSEGLKFPYEVVRDALRDSFLVLQAPCMQFKNSREFADAHDPVDWDVPNMGSATKRLQMMFTR